MKDAIGGTYLYIIVIAFIALFTTYVSVTTTYSRCFRIKDDIISIIERNHGYNKDKSISEITKLLGQIGYTNYGDCPNDGSTWLGYNSAGNRTDNKYQGKTNYCIAKYVTANSDVKDKKNAAAAVGMFDSAYYGVAVFFKLEWPIFRNIFNVKIVGETKVITNPNDEGTEYDKSNASYQNYINNV